MAQIVLYRHHRTPTIRFIFAVIVLLLFCSAVGSCRISEPRKNEAVPELDSEAVAFNTGVMPCEPRRFDVYVTDQSRYSMLQYVRYSTENRLDLVPVDPNDQLIPLVRGNTWAYRIFTGMSPSYYFGTDWKQWEQGWEPYPAGIDSGEWEQGWQVYLTRRINIRQTIYQLSRMMPDTLYDTALLPLQGGYWKLTAEELERGIMLCDGEGMEINIDHLIPQDPFDEEKYYNSIYPGGKPPEEKVYKKYEFENMNMGVRTWYVSRTQLVSGDEFYVFSSDPRGIIVGTVPIPSSKRLPVRGDDTVTFVGFIPNDPHPYDACGRKTGWELQMPVTTPAGVFRCYRYVSPSFDTTYFARGIGVVRAAGARSRYTRDSPSFWKGSPNPPPNFLQLASYRIRN